jgi:hypothetical protein
MPNSVHVGLTKSRETFILIQLRLEDPFEKLSGPRRQLRMLVSYLRDALVRQIDDRRKLILIKHWHVPLAAPAPQYLHGPPSGIHSRSFDEPVSTLGHERRDPAAS